MNNKRKMKKKKALEFKVMGRKEFWMWKAKLTVQIQSLKCGNKI
jgi:hypothetical protein